MRKKHVLNSPRILELKKKRRRALQGKIFLVILVLALVTGSFVFVARLPKLNIQGIEVAGNKIIETESIKEVYAENTAGEYLWLFPKTNFLLYPKNKIKDSLRNRYKRLKDISFETNQSQILQVSVSEREGKYTWCGENLPSAEENLGEKCYFLDDGGYIFDEAPYFSGNVYFRFFGKITGEDPAGASFLPQNFGNVARLREFVEKIGLKPVALVAEGDNHLGDAQFILESPKPLSGSPRIIFKESANFEKIAENLQSAIDTDPLKTELKNKYNSLLYIDLRFGNKVYYKFKN